MKLFYLFTLLIAQSALSQIIDFADPAFKAKLLSNNPAAPVGFDSFGSSMIIDANGDGEIDQSEALAVYAMELFMTNVSDISGIEYFQNLTRLEIYSSPITSIDISSLPNLLVFRCNFTLLQNIVLNGEIESVEVDNNQLEMLDVSSCPNLHLLNCQNNSLDVLNISVNTNLLTLNCSNNQISILDVAAAPNLSNLFCNDNDIAVLDVSELENLSELECNNNGISVLDISGLDDLERLECNGNLLNILDTAGKTMLKKLSCDNNQITELDMQGVGSDVENFDFFNMFELSCSNNLFTELDLSVLGPETRVTANVGNNPNLAFLNVKLGVLFQDSIGGEPPVPAPGIYFEGTPNLLYVCTDEINQAYIEQKVGQYGLTNCVVNSYCSFLPGENYFLISGNSIYDADGDGCDASDDGFANLHYSITDGTNTRTFFFTDSAYSIAALEGTHTVMPQFEHPEFFTSFPPSVTVTFPDDATPFLQDFCIAPNGNHADVATVISPLDNARPGFDSNYRITVTNHGTMTHDASVSFNYNDSVWDLIQANPSNSGANTNEINWNVTDLSPLETRAIDIVLNLNSPAETPAVNGGDVVSFSATIAIAATDEFMENNTFSLNQTVVNSFDPNDKRCLQGDIVGFETVGNYVHYMIRFENTGTFAAQNIVVKDMIDTAKFDVATLIPIGGSHAFETRINGNKVEFIFEDIQLPFDDANNDGYIVFKIKTKPTLIVGETFENQASIYFDYNFPIVTNLASTEIVSLSNNDFAFSDHFTLHPNPATNFLSIATNLEISSVSIYNTLGQLLEMHANLSQLIDVSGLAKGSYIVKIESEKGVASGVFLKG